MAPGAQARDALAAHPGVARLSFDGDAADGQFVVLEAAGHGKDLSAEVAGHAPGLIFADADLDLAVDSALFGADGGLHLDLRPAAGASAGASHRVGKHLGELPQRTGPASCSRGPPAGPGRRGRRARQHRLLHAVPDRAHRGRRRARAPVLSLSGERSPG
jgi:hypothetical protein